MNEQFNNQDLNIWRKLWQDNRSRFGMLVLGLAFFIAIFGAYLRPDNSKNANSQNLSLAKKKPGFECDFLRIKKNGKEEASIFGQGLFFGGIPNSHQELPIESYRLEAENVYYVPLGEDSEKVISIYDVLFSLKDPSKTINGGEQGIVLFDGSQVQSKLSELASRTGEFIVTKKYYLGTDTFGRDMLSRLMGGVIFSLSVGFISVLISLIIGISLGAIAGYYRGWVDQLIMWFVNVIWSIPTLLMVIAITLVMGKGFVQVFIAVGLTMWVEVARVVRGQVIGIRELDYIKATKALGYSEYRIISKHILPNIMGPVIVISAANFASAILIEAGLSFLGIGTQIPMPSWGMMIKEHYPFITTDLAYLAVIPGICILLLVLSLMLIGNRLRDVYDVKSLER